MEKKKDVKSLEARYSVVTVIWANAGRLNIQGGAVAVQKKSNHIQFLSGGGQKVCSSQIL